MLPLDDVDSARELAQRWSVRKRYDAGEITQEDCEACDGEAVSDAAIEAHEDVCTYAGHDILDEGGGECTTCGEKLPPCPACGPYHGRKAPPAPLDEAELAALLGWVRRAMQAEHDRRRAQVCDGPRWAVCIGDLLGIRSDDNAGDRAAGAWALCESAGWPS